MEVCFSELYLVIACIFLAVYKNVLIGTMLLLLIVCMASLALNLLLGSQQSQAYMTLY